MSNDSILYDKLYVLHMVSEQSLLKLLSNLGELGVAFLGGYLIFLKCNFNDAYVFFNILYGTCNDNDVINTWRSSFEREIDNLIDQVDKEDEITALNDFKKGLHGEKFNIQRTFSCIDKTNVSSTADKQIEHIQFIKKELLNYKQISDQTKNQIIDRFTIVSIKTFKEHIMSTLGISESIIIDSLSDKLNENSGINISEAENYIKFFGDETKLTNLTSLIYKLNSELEHQLTENYPEDFVALYQNINTRQDKIFKILDNLDIDKLKREHSEKIVYNLNTFIKTYNPNEIELNNKIDMNIHRGRINVNIIDRMNSLLEIKTTHNIFDLCYWIADIAHLMDDYNLAEKTISNCDKINIHKYYKYKNNDAKLMKAHIITHLNEFTKAIALYNDILPDSNTMQTCQTLFRIGELELLRGNFDLAKSHLCNSIIYANEITESKSITDNESIIASRFKGDCYRRLGTTCLMENKSRKAKHYFDISDHEYTSIQSDRGRVWLLHESAEYFRQTGDYAKAKKIYGESITESYNILNRNRIYHGFLGLAETKRLEGDIDINVYDQCLAAYRNIHSEWGMINTNIGLGLISAEKNLDQAKHYINIAKLKAINFGFQYECKVCDNILGLNKEDYISYKYTLSHF